jgi:rsbT co-antagonist protein RsbR
VGRVHRVVIDWRRLVTSELKTYRRADLQPFDALRAPIWVFDLDRAVRWWVNLAGVELWGAPSREHLTDPSAPMQQSEATLIRLAMYRRRFERGEAITERWSLYPDGRAPMVVESTCSGIRIDDEDGGPPRLAMLVEARSIPAWEADPLERRSVEALRHVGEPVSLYSPAGEVLLRNPAALRAFGDPAEAASGSDALAATFVEPADVATSRAALGGEVQRFDARLRTAAGEQVHTLEVRATRDPMTGEPALLVCSRDLSERRTYELALERGRQLLAEQADELARLAAPVLRVWPRILVLPLIGKVDRERMAVALAALTPRITADQARAVIFDLTGAAFVDVETAESLHRALRVLRLQGCAVVVAGVLPELAGLLVASAVQLDVPVHQTIADALREIMRANG